MLNDSQAKLDAVGELRSYDHAFLNCEGVAYFAEAFGVTLQPTEYRANSDDMKGLILDGDAKSAMGMDAAVLAELVCDQLNVPYARMGGRGFKLRACCNALEAHFRGKGEEGLRS